MIAGFLKRLGPQVLKTYHKKIINSHPSLLPKYGGKGMYGAKVHEVVIASKEKTPGVTVHCLLNEYDRSDINKHVHVGE